MSRKVFVNGDALWQWLREHHLTQQAFAEEIGISAGYLSQLMNGRRSASPETTRMIAKETQLSFHQLFHFG